jgi:hypothetical protein
MSHIFVVLVIIVITAALLYAKHRKEKRWETESAALFASFRPRLDPTLHQIVQNPARAQWEQAAQQASRPRPV